jgi:hypothetical protein
MRYIDLILENHLDESPLDDDVIIHNPSIADINNLRTLSVMSREGVRAILTPTDMYVWNGHWMSTREACRVLGLSPDYVCALRLLRNGIEWDVDRFNNGRTPDARFDLREEHGIIYRNVTLNRLYGHDFPILGDDGGRLFDIYDEEEGGFGVDFFFDDDDVLRTDDE